METSITRGEAVTDVKRSLRSIVHIAGFFCMILIAIASYFAYQKYEKQREHQELVSWLTNFYQHNAPEVFSEVFGN